MPHPTRFFLTLILIAATAVGTAQPFQPGSVYFGQNDYIEYRAGNLPIIITAPHGGTLAPGDIPDRTCGTVGLDTRTQSLIREIEYEIFQLTGRYPHIIICRLAREKIDVNRDIDEATCGNAEAVPYWNEWHKFIDSASARVTKYWGKGLYIDLHGHGHTIQRLEWGYLLSSSALSSTDATLNLPAYIESSSIRSLAGSNLKNLTHAQLLRGTTSIGTMMANLGIPGVPSSQTPSPGSDPFFDGGYNTYRHGSALGGTIDGVQLEAHSTVRIDHNLRLDFAHKFAKVILGYLEEHYFADLEDYYTFDSGDTGISFESFSVPYEQNFDNVFTGDQTHLLYDNDPAFPGMYSFINLSNTQPQEFRRYTVGVATTSNGYLYNAGHMDNSADRALGMIYSSTTGPVAAGLRFVNNTGAEIRSLDIQYTGEQWRVGGSAGPPVAVIPNTLEFEYMVAGRATNIRNGGYVSVPALNFVSPNADPLYLQTAVNGNLAANRRVLAASFNVTIPAGSEIMLRWIDRTDDAGFDHLLAVDDLVVTPRAVATSVSDMRAGPGLLLIYPNPSAGAVTVEIPGNGKAELQVCSVTSSLVLARTVEAGTYTIEAGTLKQGMYVVSVSRGGRMVATGKPILLNN